MDDALAEDRQGNWAASEVGLIVPRQNGKGTILEAKTLHALFLMRSPLVLWSAHEFKTAREAFLRCRSIVDNTDALRKLVRIIRTAAGEEGIVYFAGGRPFEYHNDPEKTRAAFNRRGWSTLGDVGYLDGDGYLYLTDRKAYMIITGGVNVYPQETEDALIAHPEVADVAVLGVPDEEMGEQVKAVVQPHDMRRAGPALAAELIAFCRQRLSPIKCPRSVDFEAELPRTATGKLMKRLLRDRYWRPAVAPR